MAISINKLWLFRILIPLKGSREFYHRNGMVSDTVAEACGLERWINHKNFDSQEATRELRRLHRKAELNPGPAPRNRILTENIKKVASLLGLTKLDCEILEFVTLLHQVELLEECADLLGHVSAVDLPKILSVLLRAPKAKIQIALSSKSALIGSGLLQPIPHERNSLSSMLSPLSASFVIGMLSKSGSPLRLFNESVKMSSPAHLRLADYEHVATEVDILVKYLRQSLARKRIGVNILLHGEPGTGKTQLAKAIAKKLRAKLFEVSCEDNNGDELSGLQRLTGYRCGQSFLSGQHELILFDEIEDVFASIRRGGFDSASPVGKAWMIRLLEENPVPTLWLTNSLACIDAAYRRRFDVVIELAVPGRTQRRKIAAAACSDFIDTAGLNRLAASRQLSPAVINRAASVVSLIRDDLAAENCQPAVELLINNTLSCMGKPRISAVPTNLSQVYDPGCVEADVDLLSIAAGLARKKKGRICLSGPPGTGKSAYARWVAEQCKVEIMEQRASDLISKWVGETEEKIAAAFQNAKTERAMLLFDEVDSFLQDRRGARASWEVTQVNEMLVQMENFDGIFAATTNLMHGLDQAALRRFDLKVQFGYLRPEQAWALLEQYSKLLRLSKPKQDLKRILTSLANLTPGDFATAVRRHHFDPIATPQGFIAILQAECHAKEDARSSIGFVH